MRDWDRRVGPADAPADAEAPGFFWMAGQGGYGIQIAPAAARLAASLIRRGEAPADFADIHLAAAALSPRRLGSADAAGGAAVPTPSHP